jgi:alkylhydroperoxidase family enzyme
MRSDNRLLKSLAGALIIAYAVSGQAQAADGAKTDKTQSTQGGNTMSTTPDTRAREEQILGKPPRLAPLKPEEIDPTAAATMADVRKSLNMPASSDLPEFIAIMMNNPELFKAHMVLALHLFNGSFSVRDRELAILRSGWLSQAPYEWGEHVKIGKRLGGITDKEIQQMIVGSSDPAWSEKDRALIKAVEELHKDAVISDATWTALEKHFNKKQLMELPILVGQYQGVAYLQNTLRIRLMPGNDGLRAR